MSFSAKVSALGFRLKGGSASYKPVCKFTLTAEDLKSMQKDTPYAGSATIDGIVVGNVANAVVGSVVHLVQCIRPGAGVYNGKIYTLSNADCKLVFGADNDELDEVEDFIKTDEYNDLKELVDESVKLGLGEPGVLIREDEDVEGKLIKEVYELSKDGKTAVLLVPVAATTKKSRT